jgi:hypothetical protein
VVNRDNDRREKEKNEEAIHKKSGGTFDWTRYEPGTGGREGNLRGRVEEVQQVEKLEENMQRDLAVDTSGMVVDAPWQKKGV